MACRIPIILLLCALFNTLDAMCSALNPLETFIALYRYHKKKKRLHAAMHLSAHRTDPPSESKKKETDLKVLIGIACSIPVLACIGALFYRHKRKRRERLRQQFGATATIVSTLVQKANKARARIAAQQDTPTGAESQSWATPRSTSSTGSRRSSRSRKSRSSAQVHPAPRRPSNLSVDTRLHHDRIDSAASEPPPGGTPYPPGVVPQRRHSSPTHAGSSSSPTAQCDTNVKATRRLLARRTEQLAQGTGTHSSREAWDLARLSTVVYEAPEQLHTSSIPRSRRYHRTPSLPGTPRTPETARSSQSGGSR